jgi:ketosteroid isomerase-like protein
LTIVSRRNVELLQAMMPGPDTDVANLFRDDSRFASTVDVLGDLFDPEVESVPAWRGAGTTYSGIDGFREMWLDWLEPWVTYRVQVDEMIEMGDSVVVLVRDRGRRRGTDVEVELISGSVWTFSDGRITRVVFYANRQDIQEATGLGDRVLATGRSGPRGGKASGARKT